MQVLDRTGVGTLWSICKVKFALAGHTHSSITDGTMTVYSEKNNEVNFGGSNNSNTIYFGYRAKDSKPIPSNFVFGSRTGTATLTAAKFKGALEGNASTASNASTVNGHTVNANVPSNAKFTDTNTWRGIQDNLTSSSTSESLSANQGRVLKGLIDGKANSSHTHSWSQISGAPATATRWPSWGEVTSKPELKSWSETKSYIDNKTSGAVVGNGSTVKIGFMPKVNTESFDITVTSGTYNGEVYAGGDCLRRSCTVKLYYDGYNSPIATFTGMFDYILKFNNIDHDITLTQAISKRFGLKENDFDVVFKRENYFFIKLRDHFIYEYTGLTNSASSNDGAMYFGKYYTTYYRFTDKGVQECDSMGNLLT